MYFRTLKFILSQDDMCDPLLELLPNSESTVLHHACAYRDYTVRNNLEYLLLPFLIFFNIVGQITGG